MVSKILGYRCGDRPKQSCYSNDMRATKLQLFLKDVMSLNAGFSGMGGAQAGVIGSRSTESDVITDLRRNTMAFATEYQNAHANRTSLKKLADNLEGSLRGLYAISAISEATLSALLKELNHLLQPANRSNA